MSSTVLVLIDGLRPDAISPTTTPNIIRLQACGASTLCATSVMPSITLPVHTSIFHSVPPGRHGITTNTWAPMARPLPGLVDVAKAGGLRSAFFHNWEPLRDLNRPETLSFAYFRDNCYNDPDGDQVIAEESLRFLHSDHPHFSFVYLGTVDVYGHNHGWMSPQYMEQVTRVDATVGTLMASIPSDHTIVLTSDHGGHDRSHGADIPEDMTVPWVASGPGIRQGHAMPAPVSLLDTAPTIARVLGLKPHPHWEGRCLDEIFI